METPKRILFIAVISIVVIALILSFGSILFSEQKTDYCKVNTCQIKTCPSNYIYNSTADNCYNLTTAIIFSTSKSYPQQVSKEAVAL